MGNMTKRRLSCFGFVLLVLALGLAACGGGSTPSCSWPMRVVGNATAEQVGLVHCYLRGLARHDRSDLSKLSAIAGALGHITAKDFKFSRDATSGTATANFKPNPADPTFVNVTITYGDGAVEVTGMYDMIAFGGPSVWRMAIGSN